MRAERSRWAASASEPRPDLPFRAGWHATRLQLGVGRPQLSDPLPFGERSGRAWRQL